MDKGVSGREGLGDGPVDLGVDGPFMDEDEDAASNLSALSSFAV
jgi:hypothetical protein